MENGVTAFLDKLFEDSNKNYRVFLTYFADYLRQKTDFFSGNYEQTLRAAFFHSDQFSEEIPLRPINFNGLDDPDTCFVPDSDVEDTSSDLFNDETQIVSNVNHDSAIIPETQFDPDDSINSDTSSFLNERYKPISSTAVGKRKPSVDISGTDNNGEENNDFFKVAADPNNCEPQIASLQSQPIMGNLDKSLLEHFLSSDDSSSALSSTRNEDDVSKVAKRNGQKSQSNTGSKPGNRQRTGEWSGSTTPEIDFEEIDKLVDKSVASAKLNASNQTIQNSDNALIDTEDLFAMYTQPIPTNIPPKEKPNEMSKVPENEGDDVFDAPTQKMPTSTVTKSTFAKPRQPAKKRKSIRAHNNLDSFFEMATQPIVQQGVGDVSFNAEDIFDMPTQRIINDDVYDAPTQLQSSQSDDIYDAATQLRSDTNDIFDAPTQRLNVRNESESPEPESSGAIPLGQRRTGAFESQFSQVMTPEWSMAKLIPKEPTNVVKNPISKKEENLKRKQQWIFNTSDDEDDNDDDDLDFDLTPTRQNNSVRHSMLNSSTESKSAIQELDQEPRNGPKTVESFKSVDSGKLSLGKWNPDNEDNVPKSGKRLRSLSIVLSRNEVSEYLKSDNQMSVPSSLVGKSKTKPEIKPKVTSTPKNDEKSKNKTETVVKGGPGTRTAPKIKIVNKTPQTTTKVPVTRSLRTKSNNNSPVGKDNKNTLKRKSDDIDTDENQKQPRKRATKATDSMVPPKFRPYHTESKITKKDTQKKNERKKEPAKDATNLKPIVKAPKAAPVLRENPFHSLPTLALSRRQSNRTSWPNSTVGSPMNILFTKINPKPHVQGIKSLGGFIVDTPQLGSILVCDTAIRTFKFLYAIIKGIPIVTSKWLDASYKASTFVPVNSFLLTDIKAEKRFHFSLKKSLEISRTIKLFEKYKFMATSNSQPVPNEIAELVRCGGGEFLFNPPHKFESNDRVILVTEKDDNRLWRKYQRMYDNIIIVSSEGFMQSILQQKINFNHYILR